VGGVEVLTRGVRHPLIWVLGCVAALLALPATASASQIFSNSAAITIPDGDCGMSKQAKATSYPSQIAVSGQTAGVTDVDVVVHGLSHPYPKDIRMLVVAPTGQRVLLVHEVGGLTQVSNITVTFDDAAPATIPEPIVTGSYKPSRTDESGGCVNFAADDALPAPAPAGPYGTTLAAFNGIDPNGTWSLFLVDDAAAGTGSITGGWSLVISPDPPTPPGSGSSAGTQPTTSPARKKCKKKHKHRAAASKKSCKKKK
jgi:subtilisin-like proprotein convertase family protein